MRWISVAGVVSGLTLLGVAVAASEPPADDMARVLSIGFKTPPAAVTANATKSFFRTGNHLFLKGLADAEVQANHLEVDVNAVKVTLKACDAAGNAAATARSQLCYSFDLPADLTPGSPYPLLVKVYSAPGNTLQATSEPGTMTYAGGVAPVAPAVVAAPAASPSASGSPPAGPAPGAALSGPIHCKDGEDRLRCAYNAVVSKLDDKVLGCDPKADRKSLLDDEPHNIYLENMKASDVAVLFFDAKGQPLFTLPQIDEDDRLYVVIVPQDDKEIIKQVRVTACDVASILRIGGSAIPQATVLLDNEKEAPKANPVILLASNGCA
jgi:hypothetical protein